MDRRGRGKDRLHHPRQSVGERLHRELQRAPARRTAQWRDLLHPTRGTDHHRELATALQYGSPACLDRLSRTGPGGVRPRARRMAGCATPTRSAGHAPAGAAASTKLTFEPDHPPGADQSSEIYWRNTETFRYTMSEVRWSA